MSTTSVSALPGPDNSVPNGPGLAMELESLRLLLVQAAEALSAGDALQVQQDCNQLVDTAVNLRPAFAELFPNRNGMSPVDCEQQRRRLLQPLLQARAFYLAALRRWRRSLSMRRSLMEMQNAAPTYEQTEVSRWC